LQSVVEAQATLRRLVIVSEVSALQDVPFHEWIVPTMLTATQNVAVGQATP
jgi:hypothetical protein